MLLISSFINLIKYFQPKTSHFIFIKLRFQLYKNLHMINIDIINQHNQTFM